MTDLIDTAKHVLYDNIAQEFGEAGEKLIQQIQADRKRIVEMGEEIAELKRQIAIYRGHNRRQGEHE